MLAASEKLINLYSKGLIPKVPQISSWRFQDTGQETELLSPSPAQDAYHQESLYGSIDGREKAIARIEALTGKRIAGPVNGRS